MPYVEGEVTTIRDITKAKAVTYKSNVLPILVDGAKAAVAKQAVRMLDVNKLSKRSSLVGCTGSKSSDTKNALVVAVQMAEAAAKAAKSGSAVKYDPRS
jgi:deuterolysin